MNIRLFSSFIIKTKKPCINCVNYIKHKYTNPYDEIYDPISKLGTCSIFGMENIVTGEIEYEHAIVCRTNESKCGIIGSHYKEK